MPLPGRPAFLDRWLEARLPGGEAVTLGHRIVYILPTRAGLGFAGLLVLMLLGAINYGNALGFALTFLLASMAVVSALHAHRNLTGLTVRVGRTPPVFAGEEAYFELVLEDGERRERRALVLHSGRHPGQLAAVPAGGSTAVLLPQPALHRGWMSLERVRIATRYPLGLFYAWSELKLNARCLVYPQPDPTHPPFPLTANSEQGTRDQGVGRDDFAGLRDYRPGDSPRHVAWKAAARSDTLLTKQFAGGAVGVLHLDWHMLAGMPIEARLSRLTRWVLDADAAGCAWGLRLPGKDIAPAVGVPHRERCLETLALFEA